MPKGSTPKTSFTELIQPPFNLRVFEDVLTHPVEECYRSAILERLGYVPENSGGFYAKFGRLVTMGALEKTDVKVLVLNGQLADTFDVTEAGKMDYLHYSNERVVAIARSLSAIIPEPPRELSITNPERVVEI